MSRSKPNLQARIRFHPARGANIGAISQQTSPLPSVTVSFPSPTQDPVAPPKRVVVGHTAALRLRLRPCLAPASTNQIEPSSGCRQRGRFHLKPRHCPQTLFPTAAHPRPRCSTKTSRRRTYGSATALSLSLPNICKHKSGSTQFGVPTRGRLHNKHRRCPLSLSSIRHPRPRCSTIASRHRPYGSATAPSSSVPNTCKHKSG
jgi:hypothetical protein